MTLKDTPVLAAVDVGGTTIKTGLFTDGPKPELLCRSAVRTRTENNGIMIVEDIASAIRALADEIGLAPDSLKGIGIGVPGPVITSSDGRQLVNRCVNLNWNEVTDIAGQLTDLTGVSRIRVLNDANAAALGELYFGVDSHDSAESPQDARAMNAVVITLGTGIGGGVIRNGEIIEGAFGAAGEIGHMPATPSHPLLADIHEKNPSILTSADLEYYASATGIARIANAVISASSVSSALRGPDPVTARIVFDAAREGDALACSVTNFFFDTLGAGMACIASVIDPDLFIIGGGVAAAGDFLLNGLTDAYREAVFHASRNTRIRLASLGNDAGLIGAIVPLLNN